MTENTPAVSEVLEGNEESRRDGGSFIIGQLHFHGNDLAELRKIAEINPDLAHKIVDQRDNEDAREHGSYRIGLIVAGVLLVSLVSAAAAILIYGGIFETIAAVVVILAGAALIRVVLTGEWSDTSWFGKLLSAVVPAKKSPPET